MNKINFAVDCFSRKDAKTQRSSFDRITGLTGIFPNYLFLNKNIQKHTQRNCLLSTHHLLLPVFYTFRNLTTEHLKGPWK